MLATEVLDLIVTEQHNLEWLKAIVTAQIILAKDDEALAIWDQLESELDATLTSLELINSVPSVIERVEL